MCPILRAGFAPLSGNMHGSKRGEGRCCRPSPGWAPAVWMVFMSELQNFYPRPPRGGRQSPCGRACNPRDFYPRPPRGGRLSTNGIPAAAFRFLSPPSARRATQSKTYKIGGDLFLSTPSARRATVINFAVYEDSIISIHALREEGDLLRVKSSKSSSYFYPRPPRGGRPLDM